MMKRIAWLAFGLLHAGSVHTADGKGEFAVKGAGLMNCTIYVAERERRSNVYYMIAGWLEGFISAHNKYVPDTYDVASFEGLELLLAVIDNHCRANPTDRLYPVINSIVAKLADDRVRDRSDGVELADGERRAVLYRETIRRIQARLLDLGLYKNAIDGHYTDATRAAMIAFQKDIGFEPSGFPDQATLWRLFRR